MGPETITDLADDLTSNWHGELHPLVAFLCQGFDTCIVIVTIAEGDFSNNFTA